MVNTPLSGEILQTLFNHASIGIIVANSRGEIVMVNQFALQQFGYTNTDEIKGKTIEVLIPRRLHDRHVGHRQQYIKDPKSRPMGIGLDLYASKKDGSEFPVEISLGNYEVNGEKFVMAFINDITQRKKSDEAILKLNEGLEKKVEERTLSLQHTVEKLNHQIKENQQKDRELREALDREKELGELKSRFVSVASHEFRTPLSTVLSSTYLVQKYTTTEEQPKREKHIQRIISSVNLLTDILNDFLNVGRIEEGKIQVRMSTNNVSKIVNETIQELNNLRKPSQKFIYSFDGEAETEIDPSMFKNIIINLLSNAVKFSPEGSDIFVHTYIGNGSFVLKVKDFGIGIPAEDQEHLFERFFRATNAVNIQGTGLGLHIVGRYAELMDGVITVNSGEGKGTEFIITFKR